MIHLVILQCYQNLLNVKKINLQGAISKYLSCDELLSVFILSIFSFNFSVYFLNCMNSSSKSSIFFSSSNVNNLINFWKLSSWLQLMMKCTKICHKNYQLNYFPIFHSKIVFQCILLNPNNFVPFNILFFRKMDNEQCFGKFVDIINGGDYYIKKVTIQNSNRFLV